MKVDLFIIAEARLSKQAHRSFKPPYSEIRLPHTYQSKNLVLNNARSIINDKLASYHTFTINTTLTFF